MRPHCMHADTQQFRNGLTALPLANHSQNGPFPAGQQVELLRRPCCLGDDLRSPGIRLPRVKQIRKRFIQFLERSHFFDKEQLVGPLNDIREFRQSLPRQHEDSGRRGLALHEIDQHFTTQFGQTEIDDTKLRTMITELLPTILSITGFKDVRRLKGILQMIPHQGTKDRFVFYN